MPAPLRIGTRGSPLALAQARLVADALRAAHGWGEDAIEIVPITTSGDVIQDRPLAEVGGNRRLAAERLGIGVRTLYEKLKRYGIE